MAGTFYQTCIYLTLAILLFCLAVAVVDATDAFDSTNNLEVGPEGLQQEDATDNALDTLTDLEDPTMLAIYSLATVGGAVSLVVAWVTHSITPIGVWLFGTVFWALWGATQSVLSLGELGPAFLGLINILVMFTFVAAIIGMLTGSG